MGKQEKNPIEERLEMLAEREEIEVKELGSLGTLPAEVNRRNALCLYVNYLTMSPIIERRDPEFLENINRVGGSWMQLGGGDFKDQMYHSACMRGTNQSEGVEKSKIYRKIKRVERWASRKILNYIDAKSNFGDYCYYGEKVVLAEKVRSYAFSAMGLLNSRQLDEQEYSFIMRHSVRKIAKDVLYGTQLAGIRERKGRTLKFL